MSAPRAASDERDAMFKNWRCRLNRRLTSRRLYYWHVDFSIAFLPSHRGSFSHTVQIRDSSNDNRPLSLVQEAVAGAWQTHLIVLQLLLLHFGILLLAQLWHRRRHRAARQHQFSTNEKLALALQELRDLRATLNLADSAAPPRYEDEVPRHQAQQSEPRIRQR